MEHMDAAELYRSRIYACAVPPAAVQLVWLWRIDRVQRRVCQAIVACPTAWPLVTERLDVWLGGRDDPAILGRWAASSAAPAVHFAEALMLLREGRCTPQRLWTALTPLRLRAEYMADLQTHLAAAAPAVARLWRGWGACSVADWNRCGH